MPPLFSSYRVNEKSRGLRERGGAEEEEGGDGEESAGACGTGPGAAAAAPAAAVGSSSSSTSNATRMTLIFVVVAPDFGCLPGGVGSGAGCSDRFVTKHEVEYERRQFGDQVHHRLTKGWHALCLNLGASVGDTLEMSKYRDGESEGIEGGGGADNDGSATAFFFQEKAPPRYSFAL